MGKAEDRFAKKAKAKQKVFYDRAAAKMSPGTAEQYRDASGPPRQQRQEIPMMQKDAGYSLRLFPRDAD